MPRLSDIFLVETPEQKAVVFRTQASESQIPALIGAGFSKLAQYVGQKALAAADTPFLRISGQDPAALELTMGLALPQAAPPAGEIEAFVIPAGRKIFCYYQGHNSQMAPVYDEMRAFAQDKGFSLDQGFFEYYLNGPEYGADKLLTKIMIPLIG